MMKTKTINVNVGFKPFQAQKNVINAFNDDSVFGITVVASRQSGKTYCVTNLIIFSALKFSGIKILVVLPFMAQVSKNFKQTYNKLKKQDFLIKNKKETPGEMEINLINGSTILFRSAASKESLRGLTIQQAFVDEASYVDFSTINEIILPMLITKTREDIPKKLVLTSTPRGKKNWFYEYYNLPLKNNRYKSFMWNYKDNPFSDLDFIMDQKNTMPEQIFLQEFECQFVDGGDLFKDILKVCSYNPVYEKEEVFIGIDLGFKDFTVVSVFNKQKQQVGLFYRKSDDTTELVNFIKTSCNKFNYRKIFIEINSIGKPFYDLLKPHLKNLTPWQTTGKSKKDIINNYIVDFNSGNLQLINDEEQIYEHQTFLYLPDSGKFEAKSGKNDDICMSNAIALECLKQNSRIGSYAVI